MKRITHLLMAAIAITIIAGTTSANASIIASDDSGDGAYATWSGGDNGGSGFNAWTLLTTGGTSGFFTGSATGNNSGDPQPYPAINVGGDAFGLYANGDGGANNFRAAAYRQFNFIDLSGSDLNQAGRTFTWSFDNSNLEIGGGSVGLNLRNGNATADATDTTIFLGRRFGFEFRAGDSNYRIVDSNTGFDTGIGFTRQGLTLQMEILGGNQYTLTVYTNNAASGTPRAVFANRTFRDNSGDPFGFTGTTIDSLALFNRFANNQSTGGSDADVFFNSFIVTELDEILAVPEPSTVLLWVAGAATAYLSRRLRRR